MSWIRSVGAAAARSGRKQLCDRLKGQDSLDSLHCADRIVPGPESAREKACGR